MKTNIASVNSSTSLQAKIHKLDDRIRVCNKKMIKEEAVATGVGKRRKTRAAHQSRWRSIEKKLKNCKVNAIAKIAVSGKGIEVQFNESAFTQENMCPNSGRSLSAAVTKESDDLKKALSVAKQTTRFAEIISKAKEEQVALRKEREKVGRVQSEEEEAAARMRGAEKLKREAELLEREKEKAREAARIALEMMKTEVELDLEDNLKVFKELEMLSGCSPAYVFHGCQPVMVLRGLKNGKIVNPLEQLGLHMKEEFLEDEDDV